MSDVRVLVVDCDTPLLRGLSSVVEEADGFEVVGETRSGEECMLAAARLFPDLVLMEINLPGMDGLEATSRLRARPTPPVVVLVSTHGEDAGAHFVPWCGAAAYVSKAAFGSHRLRAEWEINGPLRVAHPAH